MAAFHEADIRIVVGGDRMDIYGTDDEEKVKQIIELIIRKISES